MSAFATSIPFDPDRELEELRGYLGGDYDHDKLVRYRELIDAELEELGSEDELYRTSEAYLYDLTAFAMSGTKSPYLRDLARFLPPGARLLDYGCGIGSDGMALIEAGYEVAFADFDNPSTRYLHWRLEQRGLEATIYDLDREIVPAGFDAAYAFDVIEHLDDPHTLLEEMERRAAVVCVNLLEPDPADPGIHRRLPIPSLLDHAARQHLLRYRVYHRRSHLVVYRHGESHGLARAASRARLKSGEVVGAVHRAG